MKNLIDEIEKKKSNIDGFAMSDYGEGYLECVDEILELLNQHNLITAPKSIKLSEIVERLNACDKRNKFKKIIKTYETTVVENTEFKKEYIYISKNKIFDLSEYMFKDYYKWLYTLWIAGTEIIDDLECDE